MEEVIIDREVIQNNALDAWIKNKYIGTVLIPTGVGKSFIAIKAILKMLDVKNIHNADGKLKVLHLSERTSRADGFKVQIYKFIDNYGLPDWNIQDSTPQQFFDYNITIDFACYQGYSSLEGKEYHLIICDEIHEALTPAYSKIFTTIKRKGILGLTATVPHNKYDTGATNTLGDPLYISKFSMLQQYCKIIYTYGLKESIKNKTSRVNDLYFIPVKLSEIDQVKYNNLTESINFGYGTNKAKILANVRSKLINNATTKIEITKTVVEILSNLKIKSILFGTDLNALESVLNDKVITGASKKRNPLCLDMFDKGAFYVIGSYKMLKQGENIDNLDACIMMSSNRKNLLLDTAQRVGRLRLNSDKKGIVIVIYIENTFEQQYIEKISTILNNSNFQILNIDQIYDKLKDFSSI